MNIDDDGQVVSNEASPVVVMEGDGGENEPLLTGGGNANVQDSDIKVKVSRSNQTSCCCLCCADCCGDDNEGEEDSKEAWKELLQELVDQPGFFMIVVVVAIVQGFMGISVAAVSISHSHPSPRPLLPTPIADLEYHVPTGTHTCLPAIHR